MDDGASELATEAGVEGAGGESEALPKVRCDLTKPCKCCLCNAASDEFSPLKGSSEDDKYAGRRPWNKYKTVSDAAAAYRVAVGRLCLICWNVYRALGLHHKFDSVRTYYLHISEKANAKEHEKFMAALSNWIKQHDDNPGRTRLRDMRALRDAQPKMTATQSTGLRIEAPEREFVAQADWDASLDGEWDESKAETLEIAGQEIRGMYKSKGRKGVFKVREYVDNSVDETRLLQDSGSTPFAEAAMAEARQAVNQRWHSAKAERDKVSVEGPAVPAVSLDEVLKLVQGHTEGLSAGSAGLLAVKEETGAGAQPQEADEEEDEEEEGESALQAAGSAFGARKAKSKAKAKPQPALKTAAQVAAQASKGRSAAGPPERAPGKCEVRAHGNSGAARKPQEQQGVKAEPSQDARSAGDFAPTVVLDGRGQRLQESLNKTMDDIQADLEGLRVAMDTELEGAEVKKARAKRGKVLNRAASALKQTLKRVTESVNRAALSAQEERAEDLQTLVTALASLLGQLNSNSPDHEELETAFKTVRAAPIVIPIAVDAHTHMHAVRVSRYLLCRQYEKAFQTCRAGAPEMRGLEQQLPPSAVEDVAVQDVCNRLTSMLRAIAAAEATKEDSDSKQQVVAFCDALLAETQSQAGSLLKRLESTAKLVRALLGSSSSSSSEAGAALARVCEYAELPEGGELCGEHAQEERAVLQFFVEHKIGVLLAAHSRKIWESQQEDAKLVLEVGAIEESLARFEKVADIDSEALRELIRPTWAALQSASKTVLSAKASAPLKMQLEAASSRFLELLAWKTIAEMQEAVVGFCDYIREARENGGWISRLDSADPNAPKELLDLGKALRELSFVDNVMSGFWTTWSSLAKRPEAAAGEGRVCARPLGSLGNFRVRAGRPAVCGEPAAAVALCRGAHVLGRGAPGCAERGGP